MGEQGWSALVVRMRAQRAVGMGVWTCLGTIGRSTSSETASRTLVQRLHQLLGKWASERVLRASTHASARTWGGAGGSEGA